MDIKKTLISESKMFNSNSIINQFLESCNPNFKMELSKLFSYFFITYCSFYTMRKHGLIGNQKQCTAWDLIIKSGGKDSCCFHIYSHTPDSFKIIFEDIIMFPNTPVSSIDSSGPIIPFKITHCCRNSFLQIECRKGRHFRGKIIIRCSLTPNCCEGKYQITYFIYFFQSPAFTQKQTGIRWNCGNKVDNSCSISATHTEIDNSNSFSGSIRHGTVKSIYGNIKFSRKHINIFLKIYKDDIFSKIIYIGTSVTGEPIINYLTFCFHRICLFT